MYKLGRSLVNMSPLRVVSFRHKHDTAFNLLIAKTRKTRSAEE